MEKGNRKMKKKIAKFAAFIYIAALVVVTVLFTINDAETNLIREVVIEAGTDIKVEDFFHECPEDAKFVTDVSTIDTDSLSLRWRIPCPSLIFLRLTKKVSHAPKPCCRLVSVRASRCSISPPTRFLYG